MSHSIMTEMTKRVLSDSLKKLLSTKPINKITVKDIADDCKLTRQTFYYHFQDIYELLDWTYKNEISKLIKDSACEDWEITVTNILNYIKNNKSIFTTQMVERKHFERLIYQDLYQFNKDTINKVAVNMDILEKRIDFLANLLTVSLIGLIIQWINKGMKDIPEEFVKTLHSTGYTTILSILNEYDNAS